jgi:hypothetical protein
LSIIVVPDITRARTTTTEACRKRTTTAGSRIQQRSSRTPASGVNASGGRSPRAPGCAGEPSCAPHAQAAADSTGRHAGHGPAEHRGRPRACLRPCPARMPEPARLWPAVAAVPDRVQLRPHELVVSRTTRGHAGGRRAVGGRTTVPGRRSPQTPASLSTPAWPRLPDTSRPDGGCPGSSGRSIRRWLTVAQLPPALIRYNFFYSSQGRPQGRPAAPRRPPVRPPKALSHQQGSYAHPSGQASGALVSRDGPSAGVSVPGLKRRIQIVAER